MEQTHIDLDQARDTIFGTDDTSDSADDNGDSFSAEESPAEVRQALTEMVEGYLSHNMLMSAVNFNLKKLKEHCQKHLSFNVSLKSLEADFKQILQEMQQERQEQEKISNDLGNKPTLADEELKQAKELGKKDLVEEYQRALRTLGYVADRYTTLSLMHTCLSRLLDERTGSLHHGRSRSGKSKGLDCFFDLLHQYNRMRATSMTPGAVYELGFLDHVFILGGELKLFRPGEDDAMQQLWRQFLSEKELTHIRLEKETAQSSSYKSTIHTVSGFASIAWTTTKDPQSLRDEFALRLISYPSNDSAKVTGETQQLMAKRVIDPVTAKRDESQVRTQFQQLDLSFEPMTVVIPFGALIVLTSQDTTARAIFNLLLQHTKISTLYNQHKPDRVRTPDGCIIATVADYAAAYEIVRRGAYRIFESVSEKAIEIHRIARANFDAGKNFTVNELEALTGVPRTTLQGYIRQWLSTDMAVELDEKGKRGIKLYQLIDKQPQRQDLGLVSPAQLEQLLSATPENKDQASPEVPGAELAPNGSDVQNAPRKTAKETLGQCPRN